MNFVKFNKKSTDFLISGGGIIGLTLARQLLISFPSSKVTLIEKENSLCYHSSTRNSGVIHAGFYYDTSSLRAKFCVEGSQLLRDFCEKNKVPMIKCGKLVVAQTEEESENLIQLYENGIKNKVQLELISYEKATEIEPNVRGFKGKNGYFPYIYSPNTAIASQTDLSNSLKNEILTFKNCEILTNTCFISRNSENEIITNNGPIEYKKFINCSGLYADKVAKSFGFCENYEILPFRGQYLIDSSKKSLKTLIYPMPPNKNFLGVHFSLTFDGHMKIGPTAFPAFWRENYKGFDNFRFKEFYECSGQYFRCLLSSQYKFYLDQLKAELKKRNKRFLVNEAKKLSSIYDTCDLQMKDFKWGKSGIRAQLMNKKSMKLENDFIIEKDSNSIHLLNVISPGWTSSMAVAKFVCENHLSNSN